MIRFSLRVVGMLVCIVFVSTIFVALCVAASKFLVFALGAAGMSL